MIRYRTLYLFMLYYAILWKVESYLVRVGRCPDYRKQTTHKGGLQLSQLQGIWYEYARYGYHVTAECVKAKLTKTDNFTVNMFFEGRRILKETHYDYNNVQPEFFQWYTLNGNAKFDNENSSVSFKFKKESITLIGWTPNPKYIVTVDYENFFAMWSCLYMKNQHRRHQLATIFTRRPLFANNTEDNILKNRIRKDISRLEYLSERNNLEFINHDDCDKNKKVNRPSWLYSFEDVEAESNHSNY